MLTPADIGPVYAETDLSRFPVEPWNTFSNLIFLAIFIHFARKTRLDRQRHPLIVFSLPVLLVGWIGGTLFHATRSANLWLYLDFMPITILAVCASVFFWREVVGNVWYAGGAAAVLFVSFGALRRMFVLPRSISISLGYASLAAALILPALLLCRKERWRGVRLLVIAALSFAAALSFRILDSNLGRESFAPGTHFLWHIFGGIAVFAMLEFVFRRDSIAGGK